MEPSVAMTRSLVDGESVPLSRAAGRICLELVEAYPPGIPIGVPGFRLTAQAVAYLAAVERADGHLVCLKPGQRSAAGDVPTEILVLPESES